MNRRSQPVCEGPRNLQEGFYLERGTTVHVLEIVETDIRIRGRIGEPTAGWISLVNLETGARWMEPLTRPVLGDVVRIEKTARTVEHFSKFLGCRGRVLLDTHSDTECYEVEGIDGRLSRADCRVVDAIPELVLSLQPESTSDEDGFTARFCDVAGSLMGDLEMQEATTLDDLRSQLAPLLMIGVERLLIVLPDGRLTRHGDYAAEPVRTLLALA
eukprot:TRINITY_DN14753_c0_g1_i4.p1 TRINITY_DN14753_c0_g1~~TRINITY_DN14753_c0_g1_i4.p1  ORF type:complete len:215 (-),score=2.37 TRINITY_DN14753_c0_g1_i4:217-861(-)